MNSGSTHNSISSITSCLMDFYYRQPNYTGDWLVDRFNQFDFSPYYTTINYKVVDDSDYPSFPVCRHIVADNGDNILQFVLPFYKKEEISVKVEGDRLIVEGKPEKEKIEGTVVHNKIAYRAFKESFLITDKQDTAKIVSSFKEAVLTIRIPLKEEIKKKDRVVTID